MIVYKDVKKIANKLSQLRNLVEKLENDPYFDCEGIDWYSAELVSGLQGKEDGLYQDGIRIATNEGDYYCAQSTDYLGDDYYGFLYYKTDVPGQYVKVSYSC